MRRRLVFVTGGTGYLGRPLIERLQSMGHFVRALVRPGSGSSLPPGVDRIVGDALREESYQSAVAPADTFVHLVGTPRPSPAKAQEFHRVDLVSIQAALSAARFARIEHFVYVSVAHPAPIMQAYISVRRQGELLVGDSGLNATVLRPWYVLGPGHQWAWLLTPLYAILGAIPSTQAGARRLGLVTRGEMVGALTWSIEHPPGGVRVVEVPEIRALGRAEIR